MIETFNNIPEYEGLYQASNHGNIKSIARKVAFGVGFRTTEEKILKPILSTGGYLMVNLSKGNIIKRIKIHQLVAMTFLDHKPNGHKLVINHKNFIKTDNRLKNIEVVTHRENTNRKHLKSSSKYIGVHWAKKNKKWKAQIVLNGKQEYLGLFTSEK